MEDAVFAQLLGMIKQRLRTLGAGLSAGFKNLRLKRKEIYNPQYKVLKCPKCRLRMRVPRHKGRVRITCRGCGEKFERRT